MEFHILTLFPEMIKQAVQTSILGKAIEMEYVKVNPVNIRDYTENKHGKVDDYPYGGGAGMLLQAQPVYDACMAIQRERPKATRVIYLSPQGRQFTQSVAEELSQEDEIILLCGHYEGIDERVLEEIVTDTISIGDYILTGGELPALILLDAVSRLVPGVLKNDASSEYESFHMHLLEYPQYSRPECFRNRAVPNILLSGNHKKIAEWRVKESEKRTLERRPDLYKKYSLLLSATRILEREKHLNIDMTEAIRRGNAEVLDANEQGVLLREKKSRVYMITATNQEAGEKLLKLLDEKADLKNMVSHKEFLNEMIMKKYHFTGCNPCYQAIYTKKEQFRFPAGAIKQEADILCLGLEYADTVQKYYHFMDNIDYIRDRIRKRTIFGAFVDNALAGFIGMHDEGSIGLLEVLEPFRRKGIALQLEAFYINRLLQQGYVPYGQILKKNEESLVLQNKLGMVLSREKIYWLYK